jgi:hypothetical protein
LAEIPIVRRSTEATVFLKHGGKSKELLKPLSFEFRLGETGFGCISLCDGLIE